MKILITGSRGFIGRHLLEYFVGKEREIIDRGVRGFFEYLGNGNTVYGMDIKDGGVFDCRRFFKCDNSQFDLVFHAAAIVGGRLFIENFPLEVATDLAIDADYFNWAVRTKQKRIVYFSSSAAYPNHLQSFQDKKPLRESDIELSDPRIPDMTYGWTKLTGEILARYAEKQGVRVHVFRPFGGHRFDQDFPQYPFPSYIYRTVHREDPFEIWGDGFQVRDFIHIDDIIGAMMKAIELDVAGPINLGTGRATSFNELAEACFKVSGWRPKEIRHLLDRPVGMQYRVADTTKLFSFYKPKITLEESIEEGLRNHEG